jgi:Toprim domain-containing protein
VPDYFPLYKHYKRDLAGDVAHALGGAVRQGSGWLARCPCHDDHHPGLGLAEGIETSLSVMSAFRRDEGRVEHVWCALNAGNMADLPVVGGVETLVLYTDRGPAGEQAADKLAQRWLDAGREVLIATAPIDDWNPTVVS